MDNLCLINESSDSVVTLTSAICTGRMAGWGNSSVSIMYPDLRQLQIKYILNFIFL